MEIIDKDLQVFLSYSGGMDSAYVLYLLLKEGKNVLVHHVRLTDSKGRVEKEYEAVKNTLDWIDKQNLPGRFKYTESKLDTSSHGSWPRDLYIWSWFTGCMLYMKKYSHIDVLATGSHRNAFNKSRASLDHLKEARMLYGLVLPLLAGRPVEIISPIGHLTKKEIAESIPSGLSGLTWSCRKPDPYGQPCHRCHTCKQLDRAAEGVETPPFDHKNYRF